MYVFCISEEISTLLRMLLLFSHQREASLLQSTYGDILDIVRGSLNEIWQPSPPQETTALVSLHFMTMLIFHVNPVSLTTFFSFQNFGPHLTTNTIVRSMKNNETTQRPGMFLSFETKILIKLRW